MNLMMINPYSKKSIFTVSLSLCFLLRLNKCLVNQRIPFVSDYDCYQFNFMDSCIHFTKIVLFPLIDIIVSDFRIGELFRRLIYTGNINRISDQDSKEVMQVLRSMSCKGDIQIVQDVPCQLFKK